MWRRTHMIHANPANPRVATTRLLMSRGTQPHMVRTGLFMNEDGNVFSACMTCEGELGRLLDGRKNEPLVPPAFITSAVLKSFAVPLGSGSDASKSAASLQEQSSSTAPHRHSALCPGAGYAGRDGNRALPSPGRGNRANRERLDVLPVTLLYGTNPGRARFRRRSHQVTAGADSASITRCLYEWTRVGRRAPEGGGRTGS